MVIGGERIGDRAAAGEAPAAGVDSGGERQEALGVAVRQGDGGHLESAAEAAAAALDGAMRGF